MKRTDAPESSDPLTNAVSGFGRIVEQVVGLIERNHSERPIDSLAIEFNWASDPASGRIGVNIGGTAVATADLPSADVAVRGDDGEVHVLFNVEGHQVIALAAMSDLALRSPAAHQRVNAILAAGHRSLEDAAIFPDVIRNDHPETKPFHFINLFFKDGNAGEPKMPPAPHVVSQIAVVTKNLRKPTAKPKSLVDDLSWLIHMCGDIHQPLHCASRKSALHPSGDQGGNAFRLRGGARNLHSLWDSSIDVLGQSDAGQLASNVLQEHSRQALASDLAVTDHEQWARASHHTARTVAYTLVEDAANPPAPSKQYMTTMQAQGRRQAALAAYRLSDMLKAIFG